MVTILDFEFFMVYSNLLVKPFALNDHFKLVEKICNTAFCGGGHLGLKYFYDVLYSTSQVLLFNIDTSLFCWGGQLGFIMILIINNCIVIKTEGVYHISDQTVNGMRVKFKLQDFTRARNNTTN